MAERRQYSDADKAMALATLDAHGGDVAKTARQLGIPRTTLIGWAADRGVVNDVSELRQVKKRDLADRLEEIAHDLVDVMPNKMQQATLQQIATSLGITVDKMQLLRGKPTAINENQDAPTLTERANELTAILDAARARQSTPSDGGGSV